MEHVEHAHPQSTQLLPHTADLMRRAELFTLIADLVKASGESALPVRVSEGDPRLSVIDRRLFCNGFAYDLSRRPLMIKLFRAFLTAKDGWVTRDDLLHKVYGVPRGHDRSERYLDSVVGNGVKLISRTRALTAGFLCEHAGKNFEWLVYDPGRRAWQLMRQVRAAAAKSA